MEKTLIFYGLNEDIAKLVISKKIENSTKDKIKDILKYNIVLVKGEENIDKLFLLGKILQICLKNKIKAFITDFLNFEYMFQIEYPTLDNSTVIIITNISNLSKQQIQFLRLIPHIYKNKTFVLSIPDLNIYKALSLGYSLDIKIKEIGE